MTDALGQLVADLNTHGGFLHYVDGRAGLPDARGGHWLLDSDFLYPDRGHLAQMIARFEAGAFAGKRRVIAAAFMLRLGWAGGMQIGSWLLHDRIVTNARYALLFSPANLLLGVALCEGQAVPAQRAIAPDYAGMAQSLHGFAAPIAASLHQWSRLSERALLAMIASSWSAQFIAIGHAAPGREQAAALEAGRVLAAHPDLARAAPDLYPVEAAGRQGWCQKRQLCCLYFKGSGRVFCDSCPILAEPERLARNRAWIGAYGSPLAAQQ